MNILVLMAGPYKDSYEQNLSFPKYLVEIQHKPLIQRIIESLTKLSSNIICLIRGEDQEQSYLGDTLKILCPSCKVIEISGETKGAVCTALFAISEIDNSEELLVLNGDQLIKTDIMPAIKQFRERDLDAGIIVFKAVHPRYSFILLDNEGYVIQTSEKRPISSIASTGCCYFKCGTDFVKSAFAVIEKDASIQGKYYVSSIFNEMVLMQKKIGIFEINKKDYIPIVKELMKNKMHGE
ncbi:glycosyltransferase family 2 protein [Oxalobacter aliiformigenes]|uniref:Glycosyltransferase family 2 protein n=1 Tax=Oxalobacter aliiformigenes TaxID=2946593 RepID=A0A9E9NX55_9BURK|nr:glycosyltransferase family 2 protein [Oxalobacter aliiformigenes]WAV90759.1 glycosyltransferase family 2 protein [Oxalobacter aliiformigenes]WAV92797.1 glycosyltransferase family 2 protein [Oxalobacter aliiformigenes]WAV95698.1 glycosyltransferase family 2 protein [Oxalobacter aliiformigenes]WAV96507.1 glycosyltransferase family 2 protein [Oxalobacter aliiformigenes]